MVRPSSMARPLSSMAPVGSLRLPRELEINRSMDMGRALSDAGGIASQLSKQASRQHLGLSRLMTFDNPNASRALDLDTSVSPSGCLRCTGLILG